MQEILPNSLESPPPHIVTKSLEQLRSSTAVKPKCRFGGAAMHSKPVAESGHQSRFIGKLVRAERF
jgi:hypothetical protein